MQNAVVVFFTENCIIFKWCLLCPELLISVTNKFQPKIETLKMCSSNTFYVSDLLK